ncbi:coiled-coil domain-containing protein [Natronincola ferrireducens]|uniref:Peptidoglycan hydrolase PcsB coiled-coil domain-containing protein n=1 Tax=Natronincola ferrireducens TaxID=393762 RepID=A0A1G9DU44_9FIRM|nr:hypothetical protein [Natronincola ferrireducens]SDK67374.1 hypothetical protein SAMN05660472_01735 [Natronincola ferrireducens]
MSKLRKIKLFLGFSLFFIFFFGFVFSSIAVSQTDLFLEIQQKLDGISEEEKEILQNLFSLVQEIKEVEREETEIIEDIEVINQEITILESTIAVEEIAYEKKREDLKQVLKSYQRRGPGSYLEIILDSDNLTTFLRRLNILRDITRNTGELLGSLEESNENLIMERMKLTEKLVMMEEKQEKLRTSLAKKLQVKEDMEKYLIALEEEQEYYFQHLMNIQQVWEEIKPLFSEAAREFSRIIQEDNLPADALKTTFSFLRIKGILDEKTLNDIVIGQPRLPKMIFSLHPEKIEIALPEKNLIVAGTFIIEGGHTLKFQAEEGSFYGMPLEAGTIEELFREGHLALNLRPLIGDNILRSVEIMEGHLELIIIPVLF